MHTGRENIMPVIDLKLLNFKSLRLVLRLRRSPSLGFPLQTDICDVCQDAFICNVKSVEEANQLRILLLENNIK